MKKDIRVYLEDILESINKIEKYTSQINFEEFGKNTERQDAVMRRLEIIGEAVKSLPDETKQKCSDIPWKQIAGMRDVLIHEYSGVSMRRVWRVVENDLKPLKETTSKILEGL
ncbi:MAG: DUF86 domain-containing protein [Candidatus Liptonbacteria bacterium]|nr:DUF86 domain-containing protein [Candidatus Liptonbacteria bacterium]